MEENNLNLPKDERPGAPESRLQGHWLLAKMGKRVLRPGGMELTRRIIEKANPHSRDSIVEFGPGVGKTAEILLAVNPQKYIGVDPNPQGATLVKKVISPYPQASLVAADAKETGLPDAQATLVVGEAMLSMQSHEQKREIIHEAFRILAPGGRYAIHELGLRSDVDPEDQKVVAKALSQSIKVGARPLTMEDWSALLTEAGFEVTYQTTNPMHLLEPKRLIADEGLVGAARFVFNVLRNPAARKRILHMRKTFRQKAKSMNAIGIVAVKPL
ncbi:methyltransferase domain-containing protein [Actinomycetaceae bacterium TAE3-ERU4]|nr:methyltransferase domain-containing protein [Actinomycetaceae bacterium TAE3-ERU4]